MRVYKIPGVYAEEISTLPPSVAEVSTAIPAFLGYTEFGPSIGRVTTLLEYQQLFGGPGTTTFEVKLTPDGQIDSVTRGASSSPFLLYYAVSHYFNNGGGPCYIASTGHYTSPGTPAPGTPAPGTPAPGATAVPAPVPNGPVAQNFIDALAAIAAEDEPTLLVLTDAVLLTTTEYYDLCGKALTQCQTLGDRFAIFDVPGGKSSDFRTGIGMNNLSYGAAYLPYLQTTLPYIYAESDVKVGANDKLDAIRSSNTTLYNQVKTQLAAQLVVLPPSAAVAGIYASVDRDRGVWKAPANVSVASVIGPIGKLTNDALESLNIDPLAGKSINVIRAFAGKGTLVWGARTLAGNDNEWRYVPVRRLFITIEESTRNASGFAVFEPNDATTWLKVKGVIDSYLYGLWERGALAGATPAAAYYVHIGLGKTMTTQDILEGRMIVEIGVAAVRPAEFIVLRFSHKLQQA